MYLYYNGMFIGAIYFNNDYIVNGIEADYFSSEVYNSYLKTERNNKNVYI